MSQFTNNLIERNQNNYLNLIEERGEDLLNHYFYSSGIVKEDKTTEEYRNYETSIKNALK